MGKLFWTVISSALSLKMASMNTVKTSAFVQKACGPLTDLHDPSKHRHVVHSAAVPPPVSELVLTLLDACLGPIADVAHVVLVQLAELSLALQTDQQQPKRDY